MQTFLRHYFRHVDAVDVDERSIEDPRGLVESHYRLALHRPASRAIIDIRYADPGHRRLVGRGGERHPDRHRRPPVLVDSVTMETLRQGWSIREIVPRDTSFAGTWSGALQSIMTTEEAQSEAGVLPESWMHVEVLPPFGPRARPPTSSPRT